jgi:integrase
MATKWIAAGPGVRYRKHASRKHGVRLDRYYTLRFSIAGKQVEEALGWASEGWTVEKAQEKLAELRRAKRTGQGPATLREQAEANRRAEQQRAEEKAALARRQRTVRDLWERYGKEIVAVENKATTARQKARIWTTKIEPAIGHLRINDVTEEDASAVVRASLRLDTAGRVIGGRAEAANVYRLIHHMFRKALAWQLRAREAGNPLENLTEPKVARRERLPTLGEIGALMKALDTAERDMTERPQVIAAIRATVHIGARISEVLTLRRQDIRRDELELHLPDTKTGFSRRPISAAALAVLDSVERMPGVEFVFRAIKRPTAPLGYSTVENAFRRIARRAGVERCTLHTIRHWFATMTANSVSNARVGMALTGHKSHAAYMNYIHCDKEQARALADQLAALASGLAKAEPKVASISPANLAK